MERRFRVPIIIATLLVLPVLILQSTDPGEPWTTGARVGDWIIWLTFLAEVVAMLWVSEDRWGWVKRNPLDVLIVVLTPPLGQTVLHSVRALSLLRLLWLLRFATLLRGIFTVEGVRLTALLAFLTLIAGGQAYVLAEPGDNSMWSGLYWALGAMTTAGSGEVVATTTTAEIAGSILTVVGISFAAVITGAIAQRFVVSEETVTRGDLEELAGQERTIAKLDALLERMDRLEAALPDPPGEDRPV